MLGACGLQVALWAETPSHTYARHSCVMGSLDIRRRIAYEHTLPFLHARFRENELHDLGAWLKRKAFLITEHGYEIHVREKLVDELLGAFLEFV